MRKRPRPSSRIPEVNLVPMMDVLMSVLIFFVIISMSMTGVAINGVTLPTSVDNADDAAGEAESLPLTMGLDSQSILTIEGETVEVETLAPIIQAYFQANPDGSILLKADRELPYDNVADLLTQLRRVGGKRVSLAVE
ncbi:MAG: biopolymer transporter ExbD [Phormidesmis sp.]